MMRQVYYVEFNTVEFMVIHYLHLRRYVLIHFGIDRRRCSANKRCVPFHATSSVSALQSGWTGIVLVRRATT